MFRSLKFKTLVLLDSKKNCPYLGKPDYSYEDLIIKDTKFNPNIFQSCIAMEPKAKRLRLDETAVEWDLEKGSFSIDMKRFSYLYFLEKPLEVNASQIRSIKLRFKILMGSSENIMTQLAEYLSHFVNLSTVLIDLSRCEKSEFKILYNFVASSALSSVESITVI